MTQVVDRTKRTPEIEDRFLAVLADGYSVYKAAKAAGIGRQTAYDWRHDDEDFAKRWDEAVESGTDTLEDISFDRAMEKSDLLMIFNLKARRPEKYRDTVDHNHTGNIKVTVRRFTELEMVAEEVKVIGCE